MSLDMCPATASLSRCKKSMYSENPFDRCHLCTSSSVRISVDGGVEGRDSIPT